MYKEDVRNGPCFAPKSGAIAHVLPAGFLDAGVEAAKLLQSWTASAQENAHIPTSDFDDYSVIASPQAFTSPAHHSPQRAEWIDDESDLEKDGVSSFGYGGFSSQYVHTSRFTLTKGGSEDCVYALNGLINCLPDELLCHIFSFLPAPRDRSVCASVSKRWLLLQSHMHRAEFSRLHPEGSSGEPDDEVQSQRIVSKDGSNVLDNNKRVERQSQWAIGDLSRCLEGRKASDTRLAAVAVGTGARGGLGKLSLRRSAATDIGLSAIASCCAALRVLCLWDCPYIKDDGLTLIGKQCGLLEKLDLFRCPLVGDSGLQSIARNCSLLSFLSLDECGSITDKALVSVGQGCLNLLTLSIRSCPFIGDNGIISAVCSFKRLKRMKLDNLSLGDKSLACIGLYAKMLVRLSVANLHGITERGFLLLSLAQGMHSLMQFSVTNCANFTDATLAMMGKMCNGLKHISLVKCDQVGDAGLTLFMENAASLEVLQLETCNSITGKGLVSVLSSQFGRLRDARFKNCDGIRNVGGFSPSQLFTASSVKSLSITDCSGADNMLLAMVGSLCPQATTVDFSGLTSISDEGMLAFLFSGRRRLARVTLSGCVSLSDRVVCALAEQCGKSLTGLSLDGCRRITDEGLKSMAKHCFVLEDLDISQCSVTDEGVLPLLEEVGVTLSSLNLSGCVGLTSKILPCIMDSCHGLTDLNVKHCHRLSQKGIGNLESRLWKCKVLSS